jgi:hypothetical protein
MILLSIIISSQYALASLQPNVSCHVTAWSSTRPVSSTGWQPFRHLVVQTPDTQRICISWKNVRCSFQTSSSFRHVCAVYCLDTKLLPVHLLQRILNIAIRQPKGPTTNLPFKPSTIYYCIFINCVMVIIINALTLILLWFHSHRCIGIILTRRGLSMMVGIATQIT